ncbi:hypothetical protein G6F70_002293 [Rhizopus microsporus]|nr:hypothetical protein G6F70_002293 [Rhizopus microsporus]
MSASAAAKQLGIHVRMAQRWAQMYKTDPDSIFIKHKKTGRSRILRDKHKQVILEYIDENLSAVWEQVMERLLQRFQGLRVSKSTIYNFYGLVKKKELPAVVTVPKTRAQTTTILDAISASGLIKCSLRLLQTPAKKRKREGYVELTSTGTVTGHYFSFLKATMDEMDQYPHMKGYYLIMDNAPIHKSEDIAKYIISRGYRYAYLPSYSPELNPIEQFWSVVKSKYLCLILGNCSICTIKERCRKTSGTNTSSSTNAMNIFINMRSHVIVNHIHGILNVNTTRGNRSDYLDGTVPTFECQKDILTFALVSIIMDRGAGESVLSLKEKDVDMSLYAAQIVLISLMGKTINDDVQILRALISCCSVIKLPERMTNLTVGETELITNYLDPILSAMFHRW